MELNLSQETENSIRERIQSGEYASAEDVVQAAVTRLDDYDQTVADIRDSFEDERAGRVRPLEEADASIRKEHGFERRS